MTKEELLEGLKAAGLDFQLEKVKDKEMLVLEKEKIGETTEIRGGYQLEELLTLVRSMERELSKEEIYQLIKEASKKRELKGASKIMLNQRYLLYVEIQRRENNKNAIKKSIGERSELVIVGVEEKKEGLIAAQFNKNILETLNITEKNLWEMTWKNVKENAYWESLEDINTKQLNGEENIDLKNFVVVSNKWKKLGTVSVFHPEVLKEIGEYFGTKTLGIAFNSKDIAIAFPFRDELCEKVINLILPLTKEIMCKAGEEAQKLILNDEIMVINLEE